MKIDEYLALYERYRENVKKMAEALELMKAGMSKNEDKTLFLTDNHREALEKQYKRKCRILQKVQGKMVRAISRINDPETVRLLMLKYLCDLTNIRVADSMNYSERQFYRLSKKAKERLYETLVLEMPKPKKSPKKCVYKMVYKRPERRYRKYAYRNRKRS